MSFPGSSWRRLRDLPERPYKSIGPPSRSLWNRRLGVPGLREEANMKSSLQPQMVAENLVLVSISGLLVCLGFFFSHAEETS